MANERNGTKAEQLSWERRLYDAVNERVEFLRIWHANDKNGGPRYGLEASDGTQVGLAMFPTTANQQSYYLPDSWLLDYGNGKYVDASRGALRGSEKMHIDSPGGVSYYFSDHQATIPGVYRNEMPRLAFVVETHATQPVNVASPHGGIEQVTPDDARYEMFVTADGALLEDIYRLGEHEKLDPIDQAEGERLLWLVGNSKPVNGQ